MTKNGQKWSQKGPKWSEMFRKMVQMRPVILKQNCQLKMVKKFPKNGQNYPKMAKNYPKWPNITQNGPKWSEMFRQMVQMRQGIPTPNYLT